MQIVWVPPACDQQPAIEQDPAPLAAIQASPSPTPASAYRAAGASLASGAFKQIGDLGGGQLIKVVGHLALAGQQHLLR